MHLAAMICALLLIGASPAASLSWSAPIHVDDATPAGHTSYLSSLTCLSVSWCIGPDTEGRIATSINPTGGPSAWSTRSVTPYGMDQIACPSQSECVGVDRNGDVSSSIDPTGGPWSTASVDFGHELLSIACPSTTLCVGVDDFGDVVTSTNPAGGASSWSAPTPTTGGGGGFSTSCPSTTLCVSVGLGIIYSTDPVGGTSAWHAVNPDQQPIRGVACPSTELCVAVDDAGNVLTTTDPTSGAWTVAKVATTAGLRGVACPSVGLCVAVDTSGNVYTTTNPAGGASTWSGPVSIDPGGDTFAISCPDGDFCAVTDAAGHVITSAYPSGGSGAWQLNTAEAGANTIVGVSCPSTGFCVALDDSGRALTSTDPANPASWSVAPITGLQGEDALSLSCPSLALCVGMGRIEPTTVVGGSLFYRPNTIVISTAPASGGGAWSSFAPPNGSLLDATDLSCPTTRFCAALGLDSVATTTTPTSSTTAWGASGTIATGDGTASLACASAQLCLVTDFNGGVGVSTDPTDSPSRWVTFRVDTAAPIRSGVGTYISLYDSACTDYPFCIATDDGGNVISSVDPAGGVGTWKTVNLGLGYSLGPITCPAVTLCVALGPVGNVVYSYAPWRGAAGWHADVIDPTSQLSAIACPSVGMCLAGDEDGNILVGSGPATGPYAPPPSGHSSTTGSTGVSRTAARTALAGALNHSCQHEAITQIIHTTRCKTPIIAPGPGRVTITWTASRERLIARALNTFVTGGRRTVTVNLTPQGKSILSRIRHTTRVRVNATFTDTAQHRYALSRTITLRAG